jgi:aspartate/methionine/tyrosine aminotransferase
VAAVPYRLAYDGVWHVDVASARAAIGPRTRAIVLVSPNNPTGSYVKRGEMQQLAELGLPIVSDEVFASYPLRADATRLASALDGPASLIFALGGLSKLAALPQMKLGWIAAGGDAPKVDAALGRLEVIADAFLSVGAPVQHALPALLASRKTAEGAILERARANLTHLQASMDGTAL